MTRDNTQPDFDDVHYDAEDWVPETLVNYLDELREVDDLLDQLAAAMPDSPEGRVEGDAVCVPSTLMGRLFAHPPLRVDLRQLEVGLGFRTEGSPPKFDRPDDPSYCVFDSQTGIIRIRRLKDEVPYGLIRLLVLCDGRVVAAAARIMSFNDVTEEWTLEIPVVNIYGGSFLEEDKDIISVFDVPATDANRALFDAETVRKELNSKDCTDSARSKVESFLAKLEPAEGA